jgi:hypothetical protein
MEEKQRNSLAMLMLMATWLKTIMLSPGTLFYFMAVPFCGLLNDRKLFLSLQPRVNMLQPHMLPKKLSGFDPSFLSSLKSPLI